MLSYRLILRQKINVKTIRRTNFNLSFKNGNQRLFSSTEKAKDQPNIKPPEQDKKQQAPPPPPPPSSSFTFSSSSSGSGNSSSGKSGFGSSFSFDSTDKDKEIKNQIRNESPSLMNLWKVLGLAGFVAACFYYYNDSDRHERHLQTTVKLISSAVPVRKLQGLKEIEYCLYLEKRMLSGDTYIPQSLKLLVDHGFVEALMDSVLESNDLTIQELSFVWLLKLSSEDSARNILVRKGISPLIEKINSFPVGSSVWIAGAAFLCSLCKHDDVIVALDQDQIQETAKFMYQGHSPLGVLMSAKLASTLSEKDVQNYDFSFISEYEQKLFINPPHKQALDAAINCVVPSSSKVLFPSLGTEALIKHLSWATLFGILGSIYGRLRWRIYSFSKGLRGPALKKFVSKQSKVGRYVFALLVMDLVSQIIMAWPEKGHHLPYFHNPLYLPAFPSYLQPVTTSIPIIESGLFISTALYAIKRQRFVVLPLLAAAFTKGYLMTETSTFSVNNMLDNANKGTDFIKFSSTLKQKVQNESKSESGSGLGSSVSEVEQQAAQIEQQHEDQNQQEEMKKE